MPDREKVIKGLEHHTNLGIGCTGCPYNGDCHQLPKDALFLLKEQEAIRPYVDIDEYKCPTCKVKLTRQELIGENVLFEDYFDYCPQCGRKVDWIADIHTNDDQRAGADREQSRGAADAAQD